MGVMFTPTVMFFPEKINHKTIASEASVVTMPGAFAKRYNKASFRMGIVKRLRR